MLPTAIIVFREILEAALIVSVVLAATKGVPGRGAWVGWGVAGGVAGACLVAAFAGAIAEWASGMGQEVFNASVMFLAVLMLGWHNVWMSRHGRQMARELGAVGAAVSSGARPLYALAIVVGIAVLREGSEVVLFLYGIAAGQAGQAVPMAAGGVLGVAAGVAVGAAMYAGLLRIATRHLFAVTTAMIVLLAAGMASQGAAFLVQADWLPALGNTVWDTSALLTDGSLLGKTLHTLVGYEAQPNGIQLIFWAVTLVAMGGLTWLFGGPPKRPAQAVPPARRTSFSAAE
ncbi:MAG: FTR1 family protein [Proteobacteria bacterium]|nr:FTR1 family protein [Pseudomonadota bacterium]